MTDHIVLKIGNKKIKQESYVKFLGVLQDSNLSWEFHLAELSKSLQGQLDCFTKFDTMLLLKHLSYFIMEFLHHFYLMVCQCGGQHTHHCNRGENQALVGALPFCGEYPSPRSEDKFRSSNQMDGISIADGDKMADS